MQDRKLKAIVGKDLVIRCKDVLQVVEVAQMQVTARNLFCNLQGEQRLGGVRNVLHAVGEAEKVLTMLADQNWMPRRVAEANLLLTEVNAHLESFNHRSSHQRGSVARNQITLDGAEAVVQHHRKVYRPASLR